MMSGMSASSTDAVMSASEWLGGSAISVVVPVAVREDNPAEILGLGQRDLHVMENAKESVCDDGNYQSMDVTPDGEQATSEDETEDDTDDGEPVEEDGSSTLTTDCMKQAADLAERLANEALESVSFKELTSILGGEDPDGELCPAGDDAVAAKPAPQGVVATAAEGSQGGQVTLRRHPADCFEEELNEQQRSHLRRRGRSGSNRGRGPRLHPTLAGLMGQANLCVGHGQSDDAIKMCLEIIRQFPNSPLPYETLAMVFEDRGMQNKSLQFQLMAAFLSPVPDKWVELAEYYKDQDELEQAVYCYSRAIKQSPCTLSYHWSRVELLERMGNQGRALKCYSYMIKFLKPNQAKGGLKLAKEIAKIHFSQQNYAAARQAMESAFLRYPTNVSHEDVNLLLDVLIVVKDYHNTLVVLNTYAGVKLIPRAMPVAEFSQLSLVDQLPEAKECWLPDDLPIDLRSKLTVALIITSALVVAAPLVAMLMSESTEDFGDLFIDTAEAYLSVSQPAAALPVLERLLACQRHKEAPTVWRLYGEALMARGGSTDAAVTAYYKVVEFAPSNAAARLTLSTILLEEGKEDAALLVLTEEQQPYHCQVLLRKCEVLYERQLLQEYVVTAALLLGRHFVNIRCREEAEVLINNKKVSNKFESLRELRRSKGEPVEDVEPRYDGPEVPLGQQWGVFRRACSVLFAEQRYDELERLTYSALGSREFLKEYLREVEFFCLQASMANNNSYFAFNLMRDIVVRYPHSSRVWNLLNHVIIKADDFRHNRFLLRLSQKYPDILALSMLNGHNCLVAGTYKYSLAEYMKVYKGRQSDPLASLMLGLTYIHMACQKFSADKNTLVIQAWVFLNSYRELRGDCQESLYNIGRAMHQLNLLHQAIYYYELALEFPQPNTLPGDPSFDLRATIAFNLALLYRKGSENLSRYYIRKYITV